MKQKVSDNQQRISIALGFCLEVYRALMAAFLISFVPQACGGDDGNSCGLTDNFFTGTDELYLTASSLNVVTFAAFMYLYYVEISRENRMIGYLEMNRELPKDDESVGEALVKLGDQKVGELHALDAQYRFAGRGAMVCFAVNTIVSAIPIIDNKLDAKTYTVLITNVLFIVSKLMEVREIVNTADNVFYSAYLTERQQFNDADPDEVVSSDADADALENASTEAEAGSNDTDSLVKALDPTSNQV